MKNAVLVLQVSEKQGYFFGEFLNSRAQERKYTLFIYLKIAAILFCIASAAAFLSGAFFMGLPTTI
jgi:hypothetical protein